MEGDSLEDQWSNYCTMTLIYSKIYIHTSFSWKATKPTFLARTEIRGHFAIFGRTIRRLVKLLAFVLLSGGSFKLNISTHENIRETDSLKDQWSNVCTITLIHGKIYLKTSFFWKATKPTFLARTEIRRHFAIFGRAIRRLAKLLAFVLLSGGSFKLNISTHITSVKLIVLKISGQTIALWL